MKKYLSVIVALALSLCLLVTGCGKDKPENKPTDTSAPTAQNTQNPPPQTPVTETSKKQIRTGNYVCEYGDYIFYRNTNDNGSIYRYNVKDDSFIRIFDQNYNAFLHSLCIYDNFLYFVTKTETDSTPTLYRISIDGGEAELLIENVGEYCITEESIYYTSNYQLCKYTFDDKKSNTFNEWCRNINLVDGKIYFLTINTDSRDFDFAYFDTATQTVSPIRTDKTNSFTGAISANNGKLIYLYHNFSLYSYNTETGELIEATKNPDVIYYMAVANDNLVYFYTRPFTLGAPKVHQYKDGIVSEYTDRQFDDFQVLEVVDNKPIMVNTSDRGPDKIIGDERLNVVVEGAKVDNVPSIDPNNFDANVMVNYYGLTMNDVIAIWGTDYVLNDYLIGGGWAGIYYEDNRCPFIFCYSAPDIPTVCDTNEKLCGIQTIRSLSESDFFIIDGINITTSYENISKQLTGNYYPNELQGGDTFACTSIENVEELLVSWSTNENTPYKISMEFANS